MRLTIRLLGLELLSIDASTDEDAPEDDKARDLSGGSVGSMPIGFTNSWGDQRWEQGVEH